MPTRSTTSMKATATLTGNVVNTMSYDTSRTAVGSISLNKSINFSGGANETEANRGWEYAGTLASGATVVIDLNTGAGIDLGAGDGKDIVGQSVDLEDVVAIAISNNNAVSAAGKLEVEPDSSNGWTPIGTHSVSNGGAIPPNGCLLKMSADLPAFAVTSSNKRILLTANGGSVSYQITVIGRKDDDTSSSSSSSLSSSSSSSSVTSSSSSSSSSVTSSSSSSSSLTSSSSSSVSSSSSSVTSSSSSSSSSP